MISSFTVKYRNIHLILLPLVGAFMFWAAGRYTVFDDEAFSCRRYVLPMSEMVSALWRGVEPDPPLYYIIQNLWIRIFGVGPLGLRSLSIILFLAGLVFLQAAARVWFTQQAARIAFIVAALHPAHLFFGFAGRWYSTMFCGVSLLLWQTGRIATQDKVSRRNTMGWGLIAAAVCYTNYFGPVVAGLCVVAGLVRCANPKPWLTPALIAVLLYLPWLRPFWRQVTEFPQVGGGLNAYAATAGRTIMALSAGNLASISAWWVWVPFAISSISLLVLLRRRLKDLIPLVIIVAGCLIAGIASRTMIDKYVMTFSGPLCVLIGALLARSIGEESANEKNGARIAATMALAVAWAGCGVNLLTEQSWSSLRWLDPFQAALAEITESPNAPPTSDWVMSHPSARYYYALQAAQGAKGNRFVSPDSWRRSSVDSPSENELVPETPRDMVVRLTTTPPPQIIVVRAAGFSNDSDWQNLDKSLQAGYLLVSQKSYLPDADAELKNRIDPRYDHPTERIRVEHWTHK